MAVVRRSSFRILGAMLGLSLLGACAGTAPAGLDPKPEVQAPRYSEQELRTRTAESWHGWIQHYADAAQDLSYADAVEYLENGMGTYVREAVLADLTVIDPRITFEDIERWWEERERGRDRQATYGEGTWLLGEWRSRDGLEEEEPVDPGSRNDERRKIEEKVKRYLKNQQIAQQVTVRGAVQDDREGFWSGWTALNRAQWSFAYYVEHSGDFRVDKVTFRNCRRCGGGGLSEVVIGVGRRMVPCSTCRTVGVVRTVSYW